ncbi:MAG: hypothetical protein KIT27_11535, partial [Legionellales bacterium]|nr:hypothetical protein [Legionellales bacterium]
PSNDILPHGASTILGKATALKIELNIFKEIDDSDKDVARINKELVCNLQAAQEQAARKNGLPNEKPKNKSRFSSRKSNT